MGLSFNAPLTVISGGQTGADLGGLTAAKICGIPTTGWAPKGWKTERGSKPLLGSMFSLIEDSSSSYGPRTAKNAGCADVTLVFSTSPESRGTKLTIDSCLKADKGYMLITEFSKQSQLEVLAYLRLMEPQIINIAGNRETVSPGISSKVKNFLLEILPKYRHDLVTYLLPDAPKQSEIKYIPKKEEL